MNRKMIIMNAVTKYLLLTLFSVSVMGRRIDNDQVLDICMDSKHHLSYPTSTQLDGLCKRWESKSCCHSTTAANAHLDFNPSYNLNFSHCRKISQKCMQSFTLSSCFYECSPNVGPWVYTITSTRRNEMFMYVPLCQSDCESWWDACKDDLTCTDDWSTGFVWINGESQCPEDSKCESFSKRFGNSKDFCEFIYPYEFEVTNDTSMCMTFNFDGPENPNAEVARKYAKMKNMSLATGSPNSNIDALPTAVPVIPREGTIILIVLFVGLLTCAFLAILAYRLKKSTRSNNTAQIICFKCSDWCREKTSSSIVRHHRAPSDDDASILPDRDEEEVGEYDIDPRGTLELNL